MKHRIISLLSLLAVTLIAPAFAHADTFSITSVGTTTPFTMTFTLPASPTVLVSDADTFSVSASVIRNGVADTSDVITFYDTAFGGGLSDSDSSFSTYGAQLFSGSPSAPTFLLGTFNLSNSPNGTPTNYTITIASGAATTPEPSSLVLLGTGALGLAGAVRRRFIK